MGEIPKALSSLMGEATVDIDPQHIRTVFRRYGEMLSTGDIEGIVAMYTRDAVVRDPMVAPAYHGHAAIRGFYKASIDGMPGLKMWLDGEVRISGNHGAAPYIAEAMTVDTRTRIFTLDVMHFNAQGLVMAMEAYWGPSNIIQTPLEQR